MTPIARLQQCRTPAEVAAMKMTERQTDTLRTIRDYRHRHGYAPTLEELAEAMEVSKVTIHGHIHELVRKGVLRTDKHKARSLEVLDDSMLPPMERATKLKYCGEIR